MYLIQTTKKHKEHWRNRKIDWGQAYVSTWDHPHREMIMWALRSFPWISLWEVGCGPGANLIKVCKTFTGKQIGGSDINPDAIEMAQNLFKGGHFQCEEADDMLISDRAVDVVISDACLIYYSPKKVKKVIGEMYRISRNNIVLCEFYSKSWFQRMKLRFKTGYYAHNYRKLLEEAGFYDIRMVDIPDEVWPGFPWQPFGYIITAKK